MTVILDASAWVDMLIGGAPLPDPSTAITVPPHFDLEVVGTLRSLQQRGVLAPERADRALRQHLDADHDVEHNRADLEQAWSWRESLSIADGWCAALAHRTDSTWVTADRRAAATAHRLGVRVDTLE